MVDALVDAEVDRRADQAEAMRGDEANCSPIMIRCGGDDDDDDDDDDG